MTINFQALQGIQAPQTLGQLPETQSSGGGISQVLKGLSGLMGNMSPHATSPNNVESSPNMGTTTTQTYSMGQSPIGSPINSNIQGLGGAIKSTSIFNNALSTVGLKEGNPTLTAYLQKANPNLDPVTTPWCAAFVGSVLNSSGIKGTGSITAKSYLNFGQAVDKPSQGDIVVFNDLTGNNDPARGHIGFVQNIDYDKGIVTTLGGNQSDGVSIKNYSLDKVAGFRRPPTGQQVENFAQQKGMVYPSQLTEYSKQLNMPRLSNMNNVKNPNLTTNLIAKFEQFSPNTYWDVNAYRLGYGTDTITKSDGTIIPVKKGMTVTQEDALRDLNRRTEEFATTAAKQTGTDVWNKLPENAQAALTSIAYNYGSLPKRILPAVRSGDLNVIASAVESLKGDNKGINKSRRLKEAALIRDGGTQQPQLALSDDQQLVPNSLQFNQPVKQTIHIPLQPNQTNTKSHSAIGPVMAQRSENPNNQQQTNPATGIDWNLLKGVYNA